LTAFQEKLMTVEMAYGATFPGFAAPHKSFLVTWAKHNELDDIFDALADVRKRAERDSITADESVCKMLTSRLRRMQEVRCRAAGIEPAFPNKFPSN
jgi:hypothetical protein